MNLIDGSIEPTDGALVFRSGHLSLTLPPTHAATRARAVTLGIRPEFLALGSDGDGVALDCRVEAVEHLGAETILELSSEGPALTAKTIRNDAIRYGDAIRLVTDPVKVLAFDTETGERLRT